MRALEILVGSCETTRDTMVKRRRRFKQTTTLAHRLTQQAGHLRERARKLPSGAEQTMLWRKVSQAEAALRIDAWLSSPTTSTARDTITAIDKTQKS